MKTLLLFLAGLASLLSFAQDGSLDTSFGDGGIVVTDIDNSFDLVLNAVEQADRKLVVSGITSPDSNNFYPYLLRYMPDGLIDTAFGTDGIVISSNGTGFYDYKYLFIDNQQHIIAAGPKAQSSIFVIAKYLDNGDLDNTFGNSGILTIPNGNYAAMTLLDDGSMMLLKFSGSDEITINHYLSNGDLDTNFGVNGAASSNFSGGIFMSGEFKIDGENNFYLVGTRDNNANADIILMKFQPNGYLDANFGNNGMVTKNIDALNPMNFSSASIDFTNDNKIVIAGSCGACVDLFEPVMQPYFIRYQNDGMPDPDFGNDGTVLLPVSGFSISQLFVQENQRMIVSGKLLDCFEGSIYVVSRYFEGGYIDNSFNGASLGFDHYKTIMQADGKIVSVGNTFWYDGMEDIVLLRHNNSTLLLPEFEDQKLTIYPNPSNGIFTIEREVFPETTVYQITDITGKIIASGELADKQSQINLSTAQSGIYFLRTSNSVFRLLKN